MYGWLTFYHQGHEVATDFKPHMLELQSRIQKVSAARRRNYKDSILYSFFYFFLFQSRESFNASREDIHALMRKMLETRTNSVRSWEKRTTLGLKRATFSIFSAICQKHYLLARSESNLLREFFHERSADLETS
jgi:hypothetical protein